MSAQETIGSAWAEYEHQVMPLDASAAQRRDIRNSFYGGAIVVLGILAKEATSEARVQAAFVRLNRELRDYGDSIIARARGGH